MLHWVANWQNSRAQIIVVTGATGGQCSSVFLSMIWMEELNASLAGLLMIENREVLLTP